jgi:DNA polymerase III subunit delta'
VKTESALAYLKSSLDAERMAHSWLIVGPPKGQAGGLAQSFLQLLLCTGADAPCGACPACNQVADRKHPDVLWIEPQLKSRRISVDRIRFEVHPFMRQTSFIGGWKACVISAADRLSEDAANVLLKTLEEPPRKSVFMLVTDRPQYLLPTVISRCRRLDLAPAEAVEDDEWAARTREILNSEGSDAAGRAMLVARMTGLLKEMKDEAREQVEEELGEESIDDEILDARVSARHIEMRTAVIREIVLWQRDILLLACGGQEDVIYHNAELGTLMQESRRLKPAEALSRLETVETMRRHLERNIPEETAISAAFLRL